MINREIIYERDVHRSYMKIPASREASFDEKLIFQKTYVGCIPVEKCYVNGNGQYWYNITGKQALDTYCRVNNIGQSFFETLILRICSQLEQLEWNLIESSCLVMDPELIFVNSRGEDVTFTLYPSNSGNFFEELQQLMEYLLTKLNHEEPEAVQAAYRIYEITLTEGYSMADLKDAVLRGRAKLDVDKSKTIPVSIEMESERKAQISLSHTEWKENVGTGEETLFSRIEELSGVWQKQIQDKISDLCEKAKVILSWKPEEFIANYKGEVQKKEEIPIVVYPGESLPETSLEIHPTVCLTSAMGQPKGVLVYEGFEGYEDFPLEEMVCLIGKNPRARMHIEKDTISQFHAKIDYIEDSYYIEDLNSTNGTFVNDEILNYKERKKLFGGEILRFADVKYRFL